MEPLLAGVSPLLADKVIVLLAGMAALGFPMRVTAGVRTDAEQAALYAQGRTAPGGIVTECDGVYRRSAHQVAVTGWCYAVDCAFVSATPYEGPWALYGAAAEALGLRWGGTFEHLVDRPHVEWS